MFIWLYALMKIAIHLDRYLRMIAGFFIVLSVALGWFLSPWFYLFTAFVGLNLFQSAFTNWCPMMSFLRRAGIREAVCPAPSEKKAA